MCTDARRHFFGEVCDESMRLSPLGVLAHKEFEAAASNYPSVDIDAFVVMPNHVHVILVLHEHPERRPSLSRIVQFYKTGVTMKARRHVDVVPAVIWQRSFHDHIIRDDVGLSKIREYVQNNPLRWYLDKFYSEG